jgi:hypothetical protein
VEPGLAPSEPSLDGEPMMSISPGLLTDRAERWPMSAIRTPEPAVYDTDVLSPLPTCRPFGYTTVVVPNPGVRFEAPSPFNSPRRPIEILEGPEKLIIGELGTPEMNFGEHSSWNTLYVRTRRASP